MPQTQADPTKPHVDEAVSFTFKQLPDIGIDVTGLPSEVSVTVDETMCRYLGWGIDAAMNKLKINVIPKVDTEALENALGETHYCVFEVAEEFAQGLRAGPLTNPEFDVREPMTHTNQPFEVGDTFYDGVTTLTFEDYPTDGLMFRTADGCKSQIEAHELFDMVAIEREVA